MRTGHVLAGAAAALWALWPQPSVTQGSPGAGPPPSPPQVVLSTMHQMNEMEMQVGRLAAEGGEAEAVRRYGDRLYRDHRFADRKVTALAQARELELLPPPRLPAGPKLEPMMQKAQQLGQMSGSEFDRMFLQMMVQSHEMAVSMLGDALGNLPEGEVRTLVSRLRPILQQHLDLARAIQSDLGIGSNAGGGT
jgi:putative membrane protein